MANLPSWGGVPYLKYSSEEHVVGEWIDGTTLYSKTVNFGALPNTTSKSVNPQITNLKRVISISGYAFSPTTSVVFPLPYSHSTASNNILLDYRDTQGGIFVSTGIDRRIYSECYITFIYTKTTD